MPTNYIIEMEPYHYTLPNYSSYYEYPRLYLKQHEIVFIGLIYMFMLIMIIFSLLKNLNLMKDNDDLNNQYNT